MPLMAGGDLLLFCRELRDERIVDSAQHGSCSLSRSRFLMKNCLGASFYLHLQTAREKR